MLTSTTSLQTDAGASRAADPRVAGRIAGIFARAGLPADYSSDPPAVVGIPDRWMCAAGEYREGFAEGWMAVAHGATDAAWIEDRGQMVAFGYTLAAAGAFDGVAEVLYFFEKPYRWCREHAIWNALDRPRSGDGDRPTSPQWECFKTLIADL